MDDLEFLEVCQIVDWRSLAQRTYRFAACTEAAAGYAANLSRIYRLITIPGYAFICGQEWKSCLVAAMEELNQPNAESPEVTRQAARRLSEQRTNRQQI